MSNISTLASGSVTTSSTLGAAEGEGCVAVSSSPCEPVAVGDPSSKSADCETALFLFEGIEAFLVRELLLAPGFWSEFREDRSRST